MVKARASAKRRSVIPTPVIFVLGAIAVLAIAGGLWLAFGPSELGGGAAARLAEAKKAYEAGDYADAEEQLTSIVEEDAEDLEAREALALALSAQGKNDEAVEQYKAIVEADQGNVDELVALALLERTAGDVQGSLEHFEAAIAIEPRSADLDEYARTCMQVGRYEDAIVAWGKVLEDTNLDIYTRAGTLSALSQAYQDAKMYPEAKQALIDALAILPDDPNLKARLEAMGN